MPTVDLATTSLRDLNQSLHGLKPGTNELDWLVLNPKLLILDEPTRGIDVGAKSEIHALVARLAETGMSIILISSELPEVLALSTRLLTFSEGHIVGEFSAAEASEEKLLSAVVGRKHDPQAGL